MRALEYYAGVLILTTNRVAEFDEAFRSRIHISLYYPRLSKTSTISIWNMNLEKAKSKGLDVDTEDIMGFAESHWKDNSRKPNRNARRWNGRQIKNAFQAAIALANWDFHDGKDRGMRRRPRLRAEHFEDVATTSAHFDDYLAEVHEENYFSLDAKDQRIRNDDAKRLQSVDFTWAGRGQDTTPSRSTKAPRLKHISEKSKKSRYDSNEDVSPGGGRFSGGNEETAEDVQQQFQDFLKFQAMQSGQKKKAVPSSPRSSKKDRRDASDSD